MNHFFCGWASLSRFHMHISKKHLKTPKKRTMTHAQLYCPLICVYLQFYDMIFHHHGQGRFWLFFLFFWLCLKGQFTSFSALNACSAGIWKSSLKDPFGQRKISTRSLGRIRLESPIPALRACKGSNTYILSENSFVMRQWTSYLSFLVVFRITDITNDWARIWENPVFFYFLVPIF